jgi:hypothetical protein
MGRVDTMTIERIESWFYGALSTESCGKNRVPCDHLTFRWTEMAKEHIASVTNDAFELYIGYPNRWEFSIRREHARKLAWFILWRWWIVGEWFGIRRAVWYWLLHRRCERSNRLGKLFRAGVGPAVAEDDANSTELPKKEHVRR